MPQLRQPMTLIDKSLQECVNLYCRAFERWIVKLNAATQSGISAPLISSQRVLLEWRQIQRSLWKLPYSLRDMISAQLMMKFADRIRNYDSTVRKLNVSFGMKTNTTNSALKCFTLYDYVRLFIRDFHRS
jgi:hypothetical protein